MGPNFWGWFSQEARKPGYNHSRKSEKSIRTPVIIKTAVMEFEIGGSCRPDNILENFLKIMNKIVGILHKCS